MQIEKVNSSSGYLFPFIFKICILSKFKINEGKSKLPFYSIFFKIFITIYAYSQKIYF